ncbi:hypothetical protein HAX54_025239 [Datura stramonium]|uniref:GH16 domain-containing protein n=1 Tax=Datura stramonium TaxID=4076 RepID=A0ABS8UZC9_DATST|nr:hypothetical protein [Datura stramonium]
MKCGSRQWSEDLYIDLHFNWHFAGPNWWFTGEWSSVGLVNGSVKIKKTNLLTSTSDRPMTVGGYRHFTGSSASGFLNAQFTVLRLHSTDVSRVFTYFSLVSHSSPLDFQNFSRCTSSPVPNRQPKKCLRCFAARMMASTLAYPSTASLLW